MNTVNQRNDELSRMTAVVRKVGGDWCLYPHGAERLGVRLPGDEARKVVQAILDGAR